jgi:phage-related protein
MWVGSSLDDLRRFPEPVRQTMGFALFQAQRGQKHIDAKPLKGFGGAGVLEVVDDLDGSTFRVVYTIRLQDAIYVLHAFQKKSHKRSTTPRRVMDLVKTRLAMAETLHQEEVRDRGSAE